MSCSHANSWRHERNSHAILMSWHPPKIYVRILHEIRSQLPRTANLWLNSNISYDHKWHCLWNRYTRTHIEHDTRQPILHVGHGRRIVNNESVSDDTSEWSVRRDYFRSTLPDNAYYLPKFFSHRFHFKNLKSQTQTVIRSVKFNSTLLMWLSLFQQHLSIDDSEVNVKCVFSISVFLSPFRNSRLSSSLPSVRVWSVYVIVFA